MKRLSSILLTFLLVFGILAGCASNDQPETPQTPAVEQNNNNNNEEIAAFPVTVVDGLGDDVVIEKQPERIVSLMPSNTEIAFALGLGNEVVGVSQFDNYPEEVTEKESIGGQDFNVEKVISLEPDLVLAHASSVKASEEGLQQLKNSGITVLIVHDAQNFDSVYKSIELVGKATGKTVEADNIVADMKNRIEEIKETASQISDEDKKVVFVEVFPRPDIFTTGKNTFMDEMISIVNATNAAGEEEGWIQISEEAIIELNPDVIVTTYGHYIEDPEKEVYDRQGWDDVTAIKNKAVVNVHEDKVTRSGPRLVEGVEELAKAIYPDVFTK